VEYGKEFEVAFTHVTKSTFPVRGKITGKRASVDPDEKPAPKRVKKEPRVKEENGDEGFTDQQMADINHKGQISKQTVAVLKEFLSHRGRATGGKKAELVEAVQEYLDAKGL
jgi:ATP-dependent DNA helicase 2 subunit 1